MQKPKKDGQQSRPPRTKAAPKSKGTKCKAVSSTSEDGGSDGSQEVQHTSKRRAEAKKSKYHSRSSFPEEVVESPTERNEQEDVIHDADTDDTEEVGEVGRDIEELRLQHDEQSSVAPSHRSLTEDEVWHVINLEVIVSS